MTNKKTTPTKKVAPKKTVKETVIAEKIETENVVAEASKPKRAKRVEIDRNEMIPCKSVTNGTLIYISDRTRARYIWSDFGTVQYIEMGELLDMRASQPKFLNEVQLVIDDEEVIDYLGLTKQYESLVGFDNLDAFFEKPITEIREILPKLPKGIKQTVATRARKLIEDDVLADLNTIRLLEEQLKVDLKMFIK